MIMPEMRKPLPYLEAMEQSFIQTGLNITPIDYDDPCRGDLADDYGIDALTPESRAFIARICGGFEIHRIYREIAVPNWYDTDYRASDLCLELIGQSGFGERLELLKETRDHLNNLTNTLFGVIRNYSFYIDDNGFIVFEGQGRP